MNGRCCSRHGHPPVFLFLAVPAYAPTCSAGTRRGKLRETIWSSSADPPDSRIPAGIETVASRWESGVHSLPPRMHHTLGACWRFGLPSPTPPPLLSRSRARCSRDRSTREPRARGGHRHWARRVRPCCPSAWRSVRPRGPRGFMSHEAVQERGPPRRPRSRRGSATSRSADRRRLRLVEMVKGLP